MGQQPVISLEDKIVLITGAARGQGAAETKLCVELGAQVVLTDTRTDDGNALARTLAPNASFASLDVTDSGDWARVVDDTLATHGRIDVLINNAGVYRKSDLADTTDDGLRSTIETNLIGPITGMRAVATAMPNTGGSIVNVASISGVRGHAGALAYSSSKWGLRGASRSAAREFGPRGIRVNCICPGAVDTPMIDAATLDLSHLPLPRAGTVTEIAKLVAFLASDASSYCTGADFTIDGGATA